MRGPRWSAWQAYLAFSALVIAVYYAFPVDAVQAILVGLLGFLLVIARLNGLVRLLSGALRSLEEQATTDQLTGLANRRRFHDRWQAAIGDSVVGPTALLYLDLDGFKPVNDTLGHEAGVAAVAAAVTYGTTTGGSSPGDVSTPPVVAATRLVAYQGEQPKGFTIDKVPAGWEVPGVNPGVLTIAPVDAADKNPDSFVDKIAIMLQSQDDHSTPTGTEVTVGGKPGVLNQAQGTETGQNLWVKQPTGIWLLVQIWDSSGWTQDSIVEFAAGIHVLKDAVQGRG